MVRYECPSCCFLCVQIQLLVLAFLCLDLRMLKSHEVTKHNGTADRILVPPPLFVPKSPPREPLGKKRKSVGEHADIKRRRTDQVVRTMGLEVSRADGEALETGLGVEIVTSGGV